MTKRVNIKYFVLAFCILAISVITCGFISQTKSQTNFNSSANGEVVAKAQLLDTRVTKNQDNNSFENAVGTTPSVVADIKNGDTVVLDNTNAFNKAKTNDNWEENGQSGIATQVVRFEMGTNDSALKLAHLSITATLNGKPLVIKNPNLDNSFEQYFFGLPNELSTTDSNNNTTSIPETVGRIIFSYTYRTQSSSGQVEILKQGSFTFNLLNKPYLDSTNDENSWDYLNLYKFQEAEPNYADTVSATRDDENLYFNYNNFTYQSLNDELAMPIVRYDATKYNLSYTRRVYNSLETITSNIVATTKDNVTSAVVTFTSTLNGVKENFTYKIEDLNVNPFVVLDFEDIGEYQFTLSILTRSNETTFLPVSNLNPSLLGSDKIVRNMTIFGYQLKYADDQTDTAELRNADLGLYADITHLNKDFMATNLNTETVGNLNLFNNADGKVIIPSTNQAPLWFDYIGTLNLTNTSKYFYFSQTSIMNFSKLDSYEPAEIGEYKKGSYFMDAGLYIVEVNYTLNNIPFNNLTFKQIFAFEISNTAPSSRILNLNDESTIFNDAYTNQNVVLDWDDSNPFNATITASYDLYAFDNTLVASNVPVYKYGLSNQTVMSRNGKYHLKLFYGRFGHSYSVWEFTIDKTPISNLKINYGESTSLDANNVESINSPFTLSWDIKASGASTHIEHQKMLLIKDDSYILNSLSNLVEIGQDSKGNKIYSLKNGYKTSTLSSSITYENTQEYSVKQFALHFFKIFDDAGNTKYYAILLDNTNPTFIFEPKIENKFNIIKDTTTVIWGNAKGITFESPIAGNNPVFDYIVENNHLPSIVDQTNSVINIGFNGVNIHYANLQSDLDNTNLPISTPAMQVFIDNNAKVITSYSSYIDISSGSLVVTNNKSNLTPIVSTDLEEYFYGIDVIDNSTSALNLTSTGLSYTQIEVNLDASQVLAFTDDASSIRLYNDSASNRDKVFVNYFSQRDEFKVESLVVEFYPLAMDKSLATYPYLDTPTMTQDLKATAVYDALTGKMKTDYFNLTYSASLSKEVTQAGKYVVTRIYEYNPTLFESEDDAKRTKEYTFYIDRFDIVEKITVDYPIIINDKETFTRIIGENIKLAMGSKNEQYAEFNDLLLSSSSTSTTKNVILATDLLPLNTIIPQNKYSVVENTGLNYKQISSFDLNLDVYYNRQASDDAGFQYLFSVSAKNLNEVIDNMLKVDPKLLSRVGFYKFNLTDNCGYTTIKDNIISKNINPNSFEFRIQIKKDSPQGSYYGKPNADGTDKEISHITSISGSNVSSSSDDELKFVFAETTDIYKAKINYTDVKVERRARGSTKFEVFDTLTFNEVNYDSDGKITYPSSMEITSLNQTIGIREKIPELDSLGQIIKDQEGNIIFKKDLNGNNVYKYSIILPTKNNAGSYYEGEYRITIHYYGDKDYYYDSTQTISYYSNSINVVLDHTAPNFNLLRLVYSDKYLPKTSADPNVVTKQNIIEYLKNKLDSNPTKKEQVRLFLREYAFALPSDFIFRKATNNGFSVNEYDDYTYPEHDTNSMFVRKYNKYSKIAEDNEQSYIKSDPEYQDVTKQRFEMANEIYRPANVHDWNVTVDPFYDSIEQETSTEGYGNEGYYEIIEIDQAGNQRIYTVYIKKSETNLTFSDGFISQTGDALHQSLSLGYEYQLKEINDLDSWTKINLVDQTSSRTVLENFVITPTTDIQTVIDNINLYINDEQSHKATGARYDIEFLNRFGENMTISIQRPGEQLTHTIVEGTLSFDFILPTSTNSTWIENLIVKQFDPISRTLITLTHDLNGIISTTEFNGVRYTFNSGEYYFYMIDNFGRGETQPIHYIFNIVDAKDLFFTGSHIENTTAYDVTFTYQTKLYSVEISVNGQLLTDFNDYDFITLNKNLANYTNQIYFKARPNSLDTYSITLKYNTGELEITTEPLYFNFVIDTIMPNFELSDANGNNMNYLLNSLDASTSKEVYVNWNEPINFPVKVTLKKDKASPIVIQKGYSIYLIGSYTLTMTNSLGNSVSYTFSISKNTAVLYDVFANNEKINASINSILFSHADVYNDEAFDIDESIKVYASIYPLTVIANEKKDLQAKLIFEYNVKNIYNLKIYNIFGTSSLYYNEYIALIQIDSNILKINNFFLGESSEILSNATGYSSTFYSSDVYAKWQKSLKMDVIGFANLEFVDFINVVVYYNNVFVDSFNTDTLHFTDSGEYKLYFTDISGFAYKFTSGSTVRNYYTIDLLNSVSFKINDNEPINYAIYNNSVKFQPTNTTRYDAGSFSLSVYLNGNKITASDYRKNNAYIFTKYGSYKILMNATINNTPIKSEHNFTILSKNEAQSRFTFNKFDSFEIISVIKEGIDITEELKIEQNTLKLMELNLSTTDKNNGHYEISVYVTQSELKPDQTFNFVVWINSADLNLMPSIPFGTSTTNKIKIKLNKYAIHQELGNIVLKISGMDDILINDKTSVENKVSNITLSENQTYLIQAYTESGRLLASYMITKNEPLNAIAIIVIVAGSLIFVGLVVLFIIYRTRMRVR